MGYWTEKAFSKPKSGSRSKPAAKAPPKERCPLCRKGPRDCRCAMPDMTPNKAKVKVEGKDGRTRTVTKRTGTSTDARGIEWCDTCSMRCHHGVCMNVRCPTRRG